MSPGQRLDSPMTPSRSTTPLESFALPTPQHCKQATNADQCHMGRRNRETGDKARRKVFPYHSNFKLNVSTSTASKANAV
ncbi:hypothetical protein AVEN_6856-2 [Araneus ventricosus]|nr:hypothetical protein AVEN_6856-2 [Araneus ventricosus]